LEIASGFNPSQNLLRSPALSADALGVGGKFFNKKTEKQGKFPPLLRFSLEIKRER